MGAKREAMKDISKAMREEPNYNKNKSFLVTPYKLDTKETRRLNKELGINSVNRLGNINGNKKN